MNRWIIGARPRTLPAAVVPVAIGAGAAVGGPTPVWWRVLPALVVSLALQIGVNYSNDYSDGIRGTDDVRVGPTRLVAGGLADPSHVK
ncbi:MAG TPA: 1,4-dihydroxy-2-naphthoate polyprenyltransferase, partial [Ilumatobacteraceae bacterium]|nr:1,4-dihydroxy-2-naphthoate polyprenyltransferase [Ilumatobacteraceae bacterium]